MTAGIVVPALRKRLGAELLGTFWLVLGGCGTAIFASSFFSAPSIASPSSQLGVGLLGEYVSRVYEQVRQRPRYMIDGLLEKRDPVGSRDDVAVRRPRAH